MNNLPKVKKLMIIGDSMAMPRWELSYEETWPFFLTNDFPDLYIIDKSKRGGTTDRLVGSEKSINNTENQFDLLEFYHPDMVIIQLGIVDCAPRYFSKHNLFAKILYRIPQSKDIIKKIFTRKASNCYVKLKRFENNIINYLRRAQAISTEVFIIMIAPPPQRFVDKNPNIKSQIQNYNDCLRSIEGKFDNVKLIQSLSIDEMEKYSLDEFHIGAKGQKNQYCKIKSHLREYVN
jgi:hypothetical protein